MLSRIPDIYSTKALSYPLDGAMVIKGIFVHGSLSLLLQ